MRGPRVTDHAVLRYLERVQGFDVEAVRRHVKKVCAGVVTARSVLAEGHAFIIKSGAVVTVRPIQASSPRGVPRERGEARPE